MPVGFKTRANSWVTGTNPAVNSLYLRILALQPQISGNNVSLSRGEQRSLTPRAGPRNGLGATEERVGRDSAR